MWKEDEKSSEVHTAHNARSASLSFVFCRAEARRTACSLAPSRKDIKLRADVNTRVSKPTRCEEMFSKMTSGGK